MKKLLVILCLLTALFGRAQISDSGVLRNYINANVIPNNSRQITPTQMNTIFNGMLNVMAKFNTSVGYAKVKTISLTDFDNTDTIGGQIYNHIRDTSLINKTILAFSDPLLTYERRDTLASLYTPDGSDATYPVGFHYIQSAGDFYVPYQYSPGAPLYFYVVYNDPIATTQANTTPADIQLIVGTSPGAPNAGTNSFTRNELKSKRIRVYLNGIKLADTASTGKYYSYNSAAGTIFIHTTSGSPNFVTGDLFQVEYY